MSLKVATASINTKALDIAHNVQLIRQSIQQAAAQSVDILLLPELAISGYGCEDMFFVTAFIKQCQQQLLALVTDIPEGLVVAIGLPLLYQDKLYNSCALVTHQQILGFSCKQHLAKSGVHYEPRWFESWPAGQVEHIEIGAQQLPIGQLLFKINDYKIGFEICEDAWHTARPGQHYAEAGVDLLLNPSASHFAIDKHAKRQALILAGAQQFDCIYAYCNLIGCEAGRTIYDGGNLIANKEGFIQQGKRFSFQPIHLEVADVACQPKPQLTSSVVSAEYNLPHFGQQATVLAQPVMQLEQEQTCEAASRALALGLWDWQCKTKQAGFVISLSGGADSALCAVAVFIAHVLALNDLGFERYQQQVMAWLGELKPADSVIELVRTQVMPKVLTTVYQASANSGAVTEQAACTLADGLGATHHQWQIADEVQSFTSKIEQALGKPLTWQDDDIALQNIQARVRSPGVWMLANVEHKLLLATSNLSEASVGYCTMDGDTSGVLAPIGGISKTLVLKLNRFLWQQGLKLKHEQLMVPALESIIQQTPTAELRPEEQLDEQDLMPYEVLDSIRYLSQAEHVDVAQVSNALAQQTFSQHYSAQQLQDYVQKYLRLYQRNQWKRERLAVSFHIEHDSACPKTYRRYPVLS